MVGRRCLSQNAGCQLPYSTGAVLRQLLGYLDSHVGQWRFPYRQSEQQPRHHEDPVAVGEGSG